MRGWSKIVGWFKRLFWGKGKEKQNAAPQNVSPFSSVDLNAAEAEIRRLRNKELSKEEAEKALTDIEAIAEYEEALKKQQQEKREAQADGVKGSDSDNGENLRSIIETPTDYVNRLASEWIASGEWFRITAFVTQNVYAIKYDVRNASLYVQYKHWDPSMPVRFGGNSGNGPGPIYEYSNVSIKEAKDAFTSPDIGVWIWDNIRVRGTWSGHLKPNRLVSISHGYLPRKAVLNYKGRPGEWFVPRARWDKKSNRVVMVSQLPLAPAFKLMDYDYVKYLPKRGTPDRGKPFDGRPNTGRP